MKQTCVQVLCTSSKPCQVLPPCQVSADQPLMEAGLDSLGAAELRASVLSKFGTELPATATFDHPTTSALAEFLALSALPPAAPTQSPHGEGVETLAKAPIKILSGTSAENVLEELLGMLEALLGVRMAPGAPMMAAGLDSLAGGELHASLRARFDVDLPATAVFDHPTPAALAAHLAAALALQQDGAQAGLVLGSGSERSLGTRAAAAVEGRTAWASEVAGLACFFPNSGSSAPLRYAQHVTQHNNIGIQSPCGNMPKADALANASRAKQ